ncbi:mycothione reductase [Streptomyces subrutilus]|uniref:Mycothione reductase n=1 Tax=Streptomyces subrutilus TaxID=36818 RepID=A0A5P2UT34_9ACTN|nr:mycothione reductase [Streptomyces subrutilus]QEU82030.1 mycothione reductase [Streptomyces subrutilus]WSJ28509.1 mycothione reductase [Streptomyces subrutilus]GGZ72728.1 mycothione reductase [Streptomyces subrutilus]
MRHHDLIVIGAGSGNAVVDGSFAGLDVAVVEEKWFGGTCLNAGCIPSKMLAFAAHVASTVREAGTYDVDAELRAVRWRELRDRVFGRLDAAREEGRRGREADDGITVYGGRARFTGPRRLVVELPDGPVEVAADQIVIAAGGRPLVPPPVADSGLPYETSDTVMRVDAPPRHLAVLGGGYIAAELAEVFSEAGSAVTIVEKEERLLGPQDETVAELFTDLARDRYDLRLGREVTGVGGRPGALRLTLDDGSTVEADMLLVAAGRVPNSDRLDLDAAGVKTRDDGRIVVDAYQRTTAEGVFALGDICTPVPLKHVANREAKVVAHNLLHPDDLVSADHDGVPAAVFTRPQIASVGATEQDCRDRGLEYLVGTAQYADVAYGWAMEDTTGFCKVLAEPGTGRLLGAHLMGPQAPTLIQPLVLATTLGIDAATLADTPYWIHPALTEVVENALLDLGL